MNIAEDEKTKLFITIFEQTPVSTQIFTPDGETLMVNKAWEELWNVKFSKVGSYNILKDQQLVETGSMPYIKKAFKGHAITLPSIKYVPSRTIEAKEVVPFRWLSAQMYPIKNSKGKITYLVLQHNDITQRMEADESNARLAAIVNSSDDAIVSKTLDGTIRSWNRGAEKIFGYTAKEAIGQNIRLIIPENRQSEEDDIIARLKKGKRIDHFETVRRTKNGKLITVSISISPVKNGKGEVIGASKIARDMTRHNDSERALRESEERLRIALDAGRIGVYDWDITNDKITWNENVYSIHEVKKGKAILTFKNYIERIHPDDREFVKVKIEEGLKKGEFACEFRIVTESGKSKWVTTRAIVFYGKDQKPQRMLGATSDITKQKELEQEKNDFLSMASHELKTPITSMKMFVDLLYKELSKSDVEKPKYLASRIKDQTNRLTELTNDLLDVSRIETGKLKLNKEKFDLTELIKDTVEGLQATTEHKLIIENNGVKQVTADKYRIYQVLVNLITNAIKYSPPHKKILIRTEIDGEKSIVLSVKDYGIGIPIEKHAKIFERLYQVADLDQKTYPGLGLGLFITKEIVKRHNGNIWLKSSKGKGSTFFVTLPRDNK
jgi:PAS domain S-box-containing protein